jgi:outer membrane protein assembly factor BamB
MPDRRRTALLGLAAVALLAAAGCGGGDDEAATTAATAPATAPAPAGGAATVLDGDTGRPVAAARVTAVTPSERVRLRSGPDGTVDLPEGATSVRATRQGWSVGVAPVRAGGAQVRIYDRALQSPEYGGNQQRTRHVPGVRAPLPDGAPAWTFDARTLVEFPPAVRDGVLVFGTNAGRVFAVDAATGTKLWTRKRPSYIASTPAIAGPRVYVTAMDGSFTAYRLVGGRTLWRFLTGGSPVESSPLVVGDTAYFGAWNGSLYAVSLRTGRLRWRHQAAADIKGSAVLAGGRIVFGDYAGNVTALNPRSGAVAWSTRAGQRFYGGPGFSDGTVVIGDVGGAVIGLDASDGTVRWRHDTGGAYVYSSPAIARGVVYIGSYGGRFEALDLRTGARRWSFDAGGRISGSATVVGNVVYTAILARPGQARRTWGLDTRTGAVRFRGDDGRYSPAVAAGRTLYLIGTRRIYAHRAPAP